MLNHTFIRKSTWLLSLAISSAGITLAAAPAQAQQLVLEEVIVTAQKRAESLQDVPISVAAMSGEKMEDNGILDLEELTQYMPNVNINQGRATPNLFIRGIGSGVNAGFEQSVGMYIDGVYSGRGPLANVPTTWDVARVEVLKGPQGILFGKNTIGGAINITTNRPTQEFEGSIEALWEPDDNEQVYSGVISGGITDKLAGRLAARYEGMDGWWDNKQLDEEGPDRDNLMIRSSLLWDASDTVEVLLKYEYGDFETSSLPSVVYKSDQPINFRGESPFPLIDDEDKAAFDFVDANETDLDNVVVTVNWELDFATFTSISAYSEYDLTNTRNSDFASVPALHRITEENYEQYSQELRLVSPGGETLDWIAGAYLQTSELNRSREDFAADIGLLGPLAAGSGPLIKIAEPVAPPLFDQDSDSWAIFAQGTYSFTDTFRGTLGLRYNEEEKDLDKVVRNQGAIGGRAIGLGFPELIVYANPANRILIGDTRSHDFRGLNRDEEKFTWSTNLQWDVGDDTMLYASVSTGFKGGGYDGAYAGRGETVRTGNPFTGEPDGGVIETGVTSDILEYDDETVLAYEVGAKMGLLEGAATLNIAVFRMEYDDLQVSALVGDVFRVGNAGEAISQGVEVDGRWLLTDRLTVGASVAYLDAYYDDFTGAACTIPQVSDPANNPGCTRPDGTPIDPGETGGGQDLTDEDLVYSPDWSANVNAEYVAPIGDNLEMRLNVDVNYTDEFYSALDLDPATEHDSATKINARIALASVADTWSIALIGKNLTDETTYVWQNDVPAQASNTYFAVPERPRSIAIQGRYRF
jgi:outer membrane receptor protein involved in Fe transport